MSQKQESGLLALCELSCLLSGARIIMIHIWTLCCLSPSLVRNGFQLRDGDMTTVGITAGRVRWRLGWVEKNIVSTVYQILVENARRKKFEEHSNLFKCLWRQHNCQWRHCNCSWLHYSCPWSPVQLFTTICSRMIFGSEYLCPRTVRTRVWSRCSKDAML